MLRTLLIVIATFFPVLANADARPTVAVSVSPQKFFLNRLAGDMVDVEVIIPANANPHLYEPSMAQLSYLSKATAYFEIGHPDLAFEKALVTKVTETNPNLLVINTTEGLLVENEDPHVWTSPRHVASMCQNIAVALKKMFPDKVSEIDERLKSFNMELDKLDRDLSARFENKRGLAFLVFHPAWGYFAKEYGLEQLSIEEHGKEPGAGHAAKIERAAIKRGITTIFIQPQTSRTAATSIAEELGATVVVLDPMAEEWLENMSFVGQRISEGLSRE